jgi:integrase
MKKKHLKIVVANGRTYRYYYRSFTLPNGKRMYLSADNKVDWERKKTEALREFESNTRTESKSMTVENISVEYLADFHSTDAPQTYLGRVHHLNKYINPAIGQVKARRLTTRHIRDFYKKVSARKGHKKVEAINRVLRHMLNWAQSNELGITANPITSDVMDRLRRASRHAARLKELKPAQQVFSLEVASIILCAAKGKKEEVIIHLQLLHGLRISEALALRWSDIDLLNGEIHVSRQISGTPKHHRIGTDYESDFYQFEKVTKTEQSNRVLPLHDKTRELLSRTPEGERNGLLLSTSKGTAISVSNYSRRIFNPLMKSLGLELKTHDLRKMYGSFLIAQGVNIVTVSRLMGHSTPSVTLDIYAKDVIEPADSSLSLEME